MLRWSVALASHNGASFLGDQLASLLAQERPPDEIVVYDDASTDGTVRLLEVFAEAAALPVTILRSACRRGSDVAFARAVEACSGELVALADQDDVWHPNKLATLEETFARHPEATLVFSDATVVDASLRPTGQELWKALGLDRGALERLGGRDALALLLRQPVVTGATAAVPRSVATLAFPIPDGIPRRHDGWLAAVAAALGPVVPVAVPLVDYRQHPAQQVGLGSTARRGFQLPLRSLDPPALDPLLRLCTALLERLDAAPAELSSAPGHLDAAWRAGSRAIVSDYREHLEARLALGSLAPLEALGLVAREVRSGRYAKWSPGGKSPVADALRALARTGRLRGASAGGPRRSAGPRTS